MLSSESIEHAGDEVSPVESRRSSSVPVTYAMALVAVATGLVLFFVLGVLGEPVGRGESTFAFPSLLIANTPAGGDLGGHVVLPEIIRDVLLPSGRLLGWSNSWFAGFPALYFYFPVPMLAIVALDVLLPYGVALKLVAVAGLLALPGAVYFLVRRLGFEPIVAAVSAVSTALFTFMESYAIYGGNIKSTLVGEFAFSWSLALGIVYLGIVIGDTRSGRGFRPLPGVILGLVGLSHGVSAGVFVLASAVLLRRREARSVVLGSWALAVGLSAFWLLPFGAGVLRGLTTDLAWEPLLNVVGDNSPFPIDLVPVIAVSLLALRAMTRVQGGRAVVLGLGLLPLVMYFTLGLMDVGAVTNGRLLPFWYLCVHITAGVALGLGAIAVGRRYRIRPDGISVASALIVAAIALVIVAKIGDVPGWVEWNFSGFEGKEAYAEYRSLLETIDALPPGRIAWEETEYVDEYGSSYALMLLPYWTDGRPTLPGLYEESSLTDPFVLLAMSELSAESSDRIPSLNYRGLDVGRGMKHLETLGVRYYTAMTGEAVADARAAGLAPIAFSDPWSIFEVSDGAGVVASSTEPAVWGGEDDFVEASLEWFDDVQHLDRWLVEDGPESWERVSTVEERLELEPRKYAYEESPVSDVVIEDHRVSFRTEAIGVPHMVRVSYFPNWRAHGAKGPYRAAPSLMVVIPTEEEVVLTFDRTWVEYLGITFTATTITLMVVWVYRSRRSSSTQVEA